MKTERRDSKPTVTSENNAATTLPTSFATLPGNVNLDQASTSPELATSSDEKLAEANVIDISRTPPKNVNLNQPGTPPVAVASSDEKVAETNEMDISKIPSRNITLGQPNTSPVSAVSSDIKVEQKLAETNVTDTNETSPVVTAADLQTENIAYPDVDARQELTRCERFTNYITQIYSGSERVQFLAKAGIQVGGGLGLIMAGVALNQSYTAPPSPGTEQSFNYGVGNPLNWTAQSLGAISIGNGLTNLVQVIVPHNRLAGVMSGIIHGATSADPIKAFKESYKEIVEPSNDASRPRGPGRSN